MAGDSFYFDIRAEGTAVFLGPTETRLMELAWRQPSLTVKSALSHLGPKSGLAYTTVMTVLNHLVDKGLLTRSRDGRNFVYQAVIDRTAFIRSRITEIRACLKKNFPSEFTVID
jgi:predicted transcriptional regulator